MNLCSQCGSTIPPETTPGGLCPPCLLKLGLLIAETSSTTLDNGGQAAIADQFGPYKPIRVLGEGGMGIVYLAEQQQPIRRQVALKVIKLGMNTREVIARFESERQVLALMNHPHIARVFDAGASAQGQPYFVMEYVSGIPITEYCDRNRMSIRERLELFLPVCQAIQHAHGKGVIHRDIKPSNVLVSEMDGKPFPQVIDFGIAKAIDQRFAEHTALTQLGQFVGTPEYMSPEQAAMDSPTIDARTDVYLLGVLLYQLLVGVLPFGREHLRRAGLADLPRIIREEEPLALSSRLDALKDKALELANLRRTEPAVLRKQFTGALNGIVMKALAKDKDHRYPSASDLAEEIRRYLADQAVQAQPGAADRRLNIKLRNWIPSLALLLVAILFVFFMATRSAPLPRVLGTSQITHDRQAKHGPLFTDGGHIYFSAEAARYVPYQVSAQGGESSLIPMQFKETQLLGISPDYSQFMIRRLPGEGLFVNPAIPMPLWVAPVSGGAPRRQADIEAIDASWSPDGQRLIFSDVNEIHIAQSDGSEARILAKVQGIPYSLCWSPDAKRLRFSTFQPMMGVNEASSSILWEAESDGRNLHVLLPEWKQPQCCGRWTPDGKYFIFEVSNSGIETIWAIREKRGLFDRASPKPVQLTSGPIDTYSPLPSLDGQRIFFGGRQRRSETARFDAASKSFVPFLAGLSAEGLDFSRDKKWITYVSYPDGTLWRSNLDGDQRLQLTVPPIRAAMPRWSPDGKSVVFMARYGEGPWRILLLPAEGGQPEQLTSGDNSTGYDPTWSPDGGVLIVGGQANANSVLQRLDLATHTLSEIPNSRGLYSPRYSPDGRYIAAQSSDSARLLVFDVRSHSWMEVARGNIGYPSWSRDGKYIYFDTYGADGAFFRVGISNRAVERIVSLKDVRRGVGTFGPWTGLAPDDSPLIQRDASLDEIYALRWEAP